LVFETVLLGDTGTHTHARNHFTALFPGLPGWPSARRKPSSGLYGAREDNRGRHSDNTAWRHSIQTNHRPTSIIPPFLRQMSFLPQPSQFILAWDRQQICWLAYPMAWFLGWYW